MLLLLLLLLLLLVVPAPQDWTPLIILVPPIELLSGARLMTGLKSIEFARTKLGKDGRTDDMELELNCEFISKGSQFGLNERTGFAFTEDTAVAI